MLVAFCRLVVSRKRAQRLGALVLANAAGMAPGAPAAQEAAGEAPSRRDNVVLVILDDVGIDALGLYAGLGCHRADLKKRRHHAYPQTPHIDSLAAGGVLFTQARVNPTCSTSRASMLTGRYAFRHGIGSLVAEVREDAQGVVTAAELGVGPGRSEVTLAHLARAAGYETLMAGKYHLALGTEDRALGGTPGSGPRHVREIAGFDHHWIVWGNLPKEPPPQTFMDAEGRLFPPGYYNFEALRDGVPELRQGEYATDVVVDEALRLVRAAAEPWFLVLAFNAAHSPWEWPPDERVATQSYLQLARSSRDGPGGLEQSSQWPPYNATLEALDCSVGALLGGLEADGQRERTWLFVVGDNGMPDSVLQCAVEYDDLPVGKTTAALLRDERPRFKHSVFEGGVRVPLIASGPGIAAPGRRCDALVDGVDLFPTLAQIFGVEPDALGGPDHRLDGVSFYPVLNAAAPEEQRGARRSSYVERFEPGCDPRTLAFGPGPPYRAWLRALVLEEPDGRFKLVEGRDSFGEDWRQLYQLSDGAGRAVDPFELAPLDTASGPGRERQERLTAALSELLEGEPAATERSGE
jgi:arylsulfatase A-like enzyme